MRGNSHLLCAAAIAASMITSPAWAQEAAPAPGSAPAATPAAENAVQILEVVGNVQFRPAADADWQPVAADTILPLGSDVRTGPKSSIRFRVGANSEVELKSLGIMTIASVSQDDEAIRTRLYKKYGQLRAKVQHVGDLRNDYQIATPGATLAVRGSEVVHTGYDTWQVEGIEGTIDLILREETHSYGPNDQGGNQQGDPNQIADNQSDPNNNTTPGGDNNTQTLNDTYSGPGTTNTTINTNNMNIATPNLDPGGGGSGGGGGGGGT